MIPLRFCIIIVTVVSFCGIASSNKSYPKDILTNGKDDCGNVCGKININTKDTKCGDPDKRKFALLVVHDGTEKTEEDTDYYVALDYECVDQCPTNFKKYKATNVCVKEPAEFEQDLSLVDDKTDIDDKLDSTWWIVGGVSALLVVALGIAGFFIKKRNS